MNIVYTGSNTAHDYRLAVVAEISRRITRTEQHSKRATTQKESARYAGELSALRALLTTFEQMVLDCNNS